jgi:hypothetical protein
VQKLAKNVIFLNSYENFGWWKCWVGRSPICSQLVGAIDLLTYYFGLVRHQVMLAAKRAIAQLNKNENAKGCKCITTEILHHSQ